MQITFLINIVSPTPQKILTAVQKYINYHFFLSILF